ncbi:DUF937 domain-containing protein [Flavihumibacter rivuli]|uniref:DUF937 domain-containing protein n=1 Tax=Flavihumibacter rivuli TaxID=2838156 RepID=UPI001BDE8902|nr:DUF937 domain-containing protein [Flavihumibacter rivuli]ULQ55091.1 DUF937 domain-containing protein [Flavihumibacter rivuli]
MLDQLMNLVRQQAGDAVINNPAIPNEYNEAVVEETTYAVAGGLQQALSGGQIKDVLSLFSGNGAAADGNPVSQMISGGLLQNLVGKFGIDQQQAGSVVSSLVPGILQSLVQRTNDPADSSFDLQGIFNSLSGGRTSGFDVQGLVSRFAQGGLDRDGDGDTDLQDVMAMFSGGGNQGGGGGILDSLSGLLGGR